MAKQFIRIHTPGPWQLTMLDDPYLGWEITGQCEDPDYGELQICDALADEPMLEIAANMQLISKAPDLLDGCITALQELKTVSKNEILIKRLETLIESALYDPEDED